MRQKDGEEAVKIVSESEIGYYDLIFNGYTNAKDGWLQRNKSYPTVRQG